MPSRRLYLMLGVALMAVTSLGACARAGANAELAAGKLRSEGERVDSRVRSWFDANDIGEAAEDNRPLPDTAFCYKTLGETTCYRHPIPGNEDRLTGVQLPPPVQIKVEKVTTVQSNTGINDVGVVAPPTPVQVIELPEKSVPPAARLPNAPYELTPQ